jgi:hypothetical protein
MVMIAGIVDLLQPKPGESRLDGLWPLGIGVWLLVSVLDVGGLNWGNSWPILLIFIGVGLVARSLTERRPKAMTEDGRAQEGGSSHES